jgi:AcrR family transcriptional regulator
VSSRPRRTLEAPALPTRLKPRKAPKQQRSEALVEAVLQAASQLLVERGWDGFSMQALAQRAGVSPGSLYQYFPDQAVVVAALVERQSERELAFHLERFAAVPTDATLVARLEGLVAALFEFQRREGPLMRQTLRALQHLGRYEALAQRAAQAAEVLFSLLSEHRAQVQVRDARLATHVLANAIHSLTHDGVLPRPAELDDDTLQAEVLTLVRGYLGLPRR